MAYERNVPVSSSTQQQNKDPELRTSSNKNIKNLTISVQYKNKLPGPTDDMKCQCSHYFNTECSTDPLLSSENIPSTVKSVSPDSCCTYGTHYPNRIFIGHLPGKANATDLADFFRSFGTVLEGKVVLDSFGRSRRFGFVTFANHDDVQNVLSKTPIFFKGKKVNVGPAVKKMFGAEFSPPLSPDASDANNNSLPLTSSDDEKEDNETIITVPPVNEPKDATSTSPTTPKSGNVWLKVNTKPKIMPKKPQETKPTTILQPRFVYPTSRQPINPYQQQQQQQNLQFFYPQVYALPSNQSYPYQGGYYAQSPLPYYENGQAFYVNPVQQWTGPQSMYVPGSLTVAY